jgi:pilus assembly protein CpaB
MSGSFAPLQLNSKRSRLLALACIAIVSGAVGATITGQVFAYKIENMQVATVMPQLPPAPSVRTTTVLVAARTLRFGERLDSANVTAAEWIAGNEPKGSFKTLEDLMEGAEARAALGTIEEGEPILGTKVTGEGQSATLSSLVGTSKRAITVPVDEVFGVAGFVLPGDRVDVVLTRTMKIGDPTSAQADVLLQNVKVLAIDQQADKREEVASVSRAVTLEVDIAMAQKLALGSSVGRLSLTLRAAGSAHAEKPTSVSFADLSGESRKRQAMNIIRGVATGSDHARAMPPAVQPVPAQSDNGPTE